MDEAQASGGAGGFCKEDHPGHDIALLGRAVRARWPISEEKRKAVADEMVRISLKRTTTVGTMMGPAEVDNDRNQTAAARVFASMVGQNQADEHHAAGQRVHQTQDVRILIADASGATRPGTFADIERAALGAAAPPPEASPSLPVQSPEPAGDGGPARGQDAP